MSEHQVHIALPASAVHQAWRRYVGYAGSDSDDLSWYADDGSGLTASFVSDGPDATIVRTHRDHGPDDVPEQGEQNLAEFIDGFVAYVDNAFEEIHREPGAQVGDGLAGPDGTSNAPRQPHLGTDAAEA